MNNLAALWTREITTFKIRKSINPKLIYYQKEKVCLLENGSGVQIQVKSSSIPFSSCKVHRILSLLKLGKQPDKPSARLHLVVKAELDPRFIPQLGGKPGCSLIAFQIQGNLRQPMLSCNSDVGEDPLFGCNTIEGTSSKRISIGNGVLVPILVQWVNPSWPNTAKLLEDPKDPHRFRFYSSLISLMPPNTHQNLPILTIFNANNLFSLLKGNKNIVAQCQLKQREWNEGKQSWFRFSLHLFVRLDEVAMASAISSYIHLSDLGNRRWLEFFYVLSQCLPRPNYPSLYIWVSHQTLSHHTGKIILFYGARN